MSTAEVEALFAQTLLGDHEGGAAWAAVSILRRNGSREIFEHAALWCRADDPLKRARAAAILCQLRRAQMTIEPGKQPEWMFRDESYSLVAKMLENEQNPVVLDAVAAC